MALIQYIEQVYRRRRPRMDGGCCVKELGEGGDRRSRSPLYLRSLIVKYFYDNFIYYYNFITTTNQRTNHYKSDRAILGSPTTAQPHTRARGGWSSRLILLLKDDLFG